MNAYDVLKIVSAALASLGGGGLIVMAMSGWLGRLWADRLMEKERNEHARILEQDRSKYAQELAGLKSGFEATHRRLQAELDKTVFGHQLFVQTEFEAMKAVVPCLQRVQNAIYMVRAVHKNLPPPPVPLLAQQVRFKQSTEGLGLALEELRGPLELYGPFFSEKIYTALQEYSVLGRTELVQAGIAENASSLEWCNQGFKNYSEAVYRRSALFEMIKERMLELSKLDAEERSRQAQA